MKNIDLYKEICELFAEEETVEKIDFVELNGIKYSYEEVEELSTEDDGKYQFGGTIYAIGVLKEEDGYGIVEPLFYIEQDFARCGSYFSDYYYEYESPYIVEQKEITQIVWRAI